MIKIISLITLVSLVSACASTPINDPLKNTKHLVKEGHKSLYQNGAFHVPNTALHLIPPGPDAWEFAQELSGLKARQSFSTSIQNAKDSVQVITIGSQKTYELSSDIFVGGNNFADSIRQYSRPNSILLIKKSYPHAKHIIGTSWDSAKSASSYLADAGDRLADGSLYSAKELNKEGTKISSHLFQQSWDTGATIASDTWHHGGGLIAEASADFVQGYAALPAALAERGSNMNPSTTWSEYKESANETAEWRKESSDDLKYYITDTTSGYFSNVADSFAKSKEALSDTSETGSLALLKSLGWVLHGVFWEGSIKPISKISAGSLGYIAVNTVVYPVILAAQSTASLAEVAVKVTWNTGGMAYDIVAPTAKAALGGLLGTVEIAGGQLAGGTLIAGGATMAGATYVSSNAIAATVATAGYASGKAVKYVGVPIAASGIVLGGSAVGVTVAGAEAVTGSALLAGGELVSATSQIATTATSATTLAVGTTVSTVAGLGLGVYELSKAVIVPTGYHLTSGIVLGYGSLSQIAAHSVLAVSDVSYMVLSLEGPKWVLYGVQGKLGSGEELVPGTVLDLEAMQNKGEGFKRLPVSTDEMDGVIEQLPYDLKANSI
jgi:hypothetical protein